MKKNILILGGTHFLGRVFIEKLLENQSDNYHITLFNRGQTNQDLFPQLAKIQGDREISDIKKLANKTWDYVFDFSGYYPNSLNELLELLKGNVGRYIYTSTVSIYDWAAIGTEPMYENAKRLTCSKSERSQKDMALYGKLKAACEEELEEAHWLDKIILRPSVVFGKYDYIDRHYYWLYRAKTQQKILIPTPLDASNYTFVEDYATINLKCLDIEKHNTFYNTTTHEPHTLEQLVHYAATYFNTNPTCINVDAKTLTNNKLNGGREGIALWFQLPLNAPNQAIINDFNLKFTDIQTATNLTIEYYNSIYGANWKEGTYGWRVEQEQQFLGSKR